MRGDLRQRIAAYFKARPGSGWEEAARELGSTPASVKRNFYRVKPPIQRRKYESALSRRVEGFFYDNPGEWLSWDDMATKFGCTVRQAKHAVWGRTDLEIASVVRLRAEA